MESKVDEPVPSARLVSTLAARRIRSDACDLEFLQESVCLAFKPADMSRLQRDAAIESLSENGEEVARHASVECEGWRQLNQQASKPRTQRRETVEKLA